MHIPKPNPRKEYRLRQKERVDASPLMAEKFPRLKSLKVTLAFYDTDGFVRNSEMKCTLDVERARSELWFSCPGAECTAGDFDLSEAVAEAVRAKKKSATGELRCPGTRNRGKDARVPCQTLLRYTLNLNYD